MIEVELGSERAKCGFRGQKSARNANQSTFEVDGSWFGICGL